MTLPERLRKARDRAGLSQTEVARHFGIKRSAVSQWETFGGKIKATQPEQAKFPELARLYGVDVMWLITGQGTPEGSMTPEEWELLSIFRGLNSDQRRTAIRLVGALDEDEAASPVRGAS